MYAMASAWLSLLRSVFRHAWIDLIRPRIDAAFEIVNVGKTALLQQSHRFGAALAAVAMDNDRLLALQFVRPLSDFSQWNQLRAIDPRDLVFEWFPHID